MGNEKFSILPIPEFVGSFPEYYVGLMDHLVLLFTHRKELTRLLIYGLKVKECGQNNSILNPFLELYTHWDLEKMLKKLEIDTYLDHLRFAISLHAYLESLVHINGIQEVEKYVIRQPTRNASNEY
ncbi:hypothetical protein Gotur_019251 [Gossypium turneri]